MSIPIYQRTATTGTGDIIPNAEYTVINEGTGTGQTIYSDRAGTAVKSPPYYANGTGLIQFFIAPGVTFRVAATDGANTYTDRYVYAAYAQETSTDAGAGRLMEVGAFGLGATTVQAAPNNDLNDITVSGDYYGSAGSSANMPSSGISFQVTHNSVSNVDFAIQTAIGYGGSVPTDINRMFVRHKDNGVWESWNEVITANAAGDVGIGTTSPNRTIELEAAVPGIRFTDSDSNSYGEIISLDGSFIIRADEGNAVAGSYIRFEIDGSEKVRLDNNGNLFVGKTSTTESVEGIELRADGWFKAVRSSGLAARFRRNDTDGDIVDFLTNSNTAGSIATSGGSLTIGSGDVGLLFVSSVDTIIPWNTLYNGQRDNAIDLGNSNNRFNDAYITNGVTAGSDRTLKQDILEITTAETAVAKACKSLLRSFRWKDAVIEKGDDARIHFGIIAQDLRDAFTAQGLDAGRYAMFMSDTWWETQTEVEAVEAAEAIEGVEFVQAVEASEAVEAVYGEDGEIISEAIEAVEAVEGVEGVEAVEAVKAKDAYTRTDTFETLAEAPAGATERTRLGVRYSELLAFIIAAL